MDKNKIGSIELIGFAGIIMWLAATLIRKSNISHNEVSSFIVGIIPNFAAAWTMTMVFKNIFIIFTKKPYTAKIHSIICFSILAIALLSEVVFALFFNSRFDLYDILATIIAQLIMLFVPILLNRKFSISD